MNDQLISKILAKMSSALNCEQLRLLKEVLENAGNESACQTIENEQMLERFLTAKRLEGCSGRTLTYYESTLDHMLQTLDKPLPSMTTDDLRTYLTRYENVRNASKVTIDNIRRIMSSFFSWLEDEDYIVKSPVRRIRKVRAPIEIKETLSDEHLQSLRDGCANKRDLAIIDLLASTGMRVGELVRLDIADVNFAERECIILGKGNKERLAYFDARTKLHLQSYLAEREDSNPALFVSLNAPHKRLNIGGVELRLRELGQSLGLPRVHPHKFRRTLATDAIAKGMPIEQVQKLLGHEKIDTTMQYAMVNQDNVKLSHRRYLG